MFRLVFNIYKNNSLLRAHLFYRKYERGGDCKECSYCCGENWEQSSKVESACKEQGLGRCICEPSFYCPKMKCPNPTTPIVTTAARTTTGTPITPAKKKPKTSPQNEQKTREISTSTVRNSSKTPEFHNSNAYDPKAEHSQKGEINITLI